MDPLFFPTRGDNRTKIVRRETGEQKGPWPVQISARIGEVAAMRQRSEIWQNSRGLLMRPALRRA